MRTLRKTGPWMVVVAFLLALTVSGWAAETPVFVTEAQNSFANRSPLSSGVALNSSAVLRTLSDGSASLRVGDAQVSLGHRTELSVNRGSLALNHGYARVQGAASVWQGAHAVVPSSADTEYEVVALTDGVTYVHVMRGQVRLTGFVHPTVVAAGTAVKFLQQGTGAGAAQSGSGAAGSGSAGAGAAGAGTAAGAGAATATGISVTAITIGAVAAAAVATGLIVHAASTPSSPSQP